MTDLGLLSAELFQPQLGSRFTLEGPGGAISATLVKCPVRPNGTHPDAARTAFSLVFCAPADGIADLDGGHFIVRHPAMEPFGPVYAERILSYRPAEAMFQIVFS